jgi:hypothetical protein
MSETGMYCTFCESDVIEDLPGWYACYCKSIKKEDVMDYHEHWTTYKVLTGQEKGYADDT